MRFLAPILLLSCGAENPATFTEVYENILEPSCGFSSCHGGGAGGFFLGDMHTTYGSLVNAESADAEGEILVVPGDANSSYLILKLEDAEGIVGDAMPPAQPLPKEKIERVRSWIDAGALEGLP
jgi:hypothetical protein